MGAVPPIHIIVKNGNITLIGVVDNEGDKNLAGIAANGVPGSFEVTNDLPSKNNVAVQSRDHRESVGAEVFTRRLAPKLSRCLDRNHIELYQVGPPSDPHP